ncbi:MAG: Mrp/NBP35 family ATP-binding protein, partial [Planctomycetes bacterium]|nr:Mrp/NBP35 family ATP-binding protein [Planctomycetota bacterium]
NLAVSLQKQGASVGVLDADIYGPSLPTMLGVPPGTQPMMQDNQILPIEKQGLKLMSAGFLFPPDQAAVLRGPMVSNVLQQMLLQTKWGELDYLILDMPPGTGDIQLTISQVVPLTGAVIITTPQKISLIDVNKGIAMFSQVNVPILGIIENMSYMIQDGSEEKIYLYGPSGAPHLAATYGLDILGQVPFYTDVVTKCDSGVPAATDENSAAGVVYHDLAGKVARAASTAMLSGESCPNVDIEW